MSAALLSGRGVSLSIGATRVLREVSFEAAAGEVVAVMGPSGSGKSTLLHVLAGLLTPEGGEVWLDGKRVDQLSQRARSALRLTRMGFVFQFGDLIPELTLVENVELPLRLTGTDRRAARQLATGMLDRLEVAAVANRRINEVSGGQAQRAAVARALVNDPVVVFADEPTGSLDTTAGELVLEALLGTARGQGTAVVLVTHEPRVAAYADREVILRDGAVTAPMAAGQVTW